jgi:hypothetical protein
MFFNGMMIFLIVMAFVHYTYEMTIAPSLRTWLKNDMLALRDRLRSLQAMSWKDEKGFDIVESSIDLAIKNLQVYNVAVLYEARMLLRSEVGLKVLVFEQGLLIEKSSMKELPEIVNCLGGYVLKAVAINSGGFFFWTWPVFLVIYTVQKIRRIGSNSLMELLRSILYVPQGVLYRLTHTT